MQEPADEQPADQASELAGEILAELYLAPHGISSLPLARLADRTQAYERDRQRSGRDHRGDDGAARRDARHHCAILAQFVERVDLYDAERQLAESDTRPYLIRPSWQWLQVKRAGGIGDRTDRVPELWTGFIEARALPEALNLWSGQG